MAYKKQPYKKKNYTYSKPKKIEKEIVEEVTRKWGSFATESFVGSSFDTETINYNARGFNLKNVQMMLESPEKHYEKLQNMSHLAMFRDGLYYKIIKGLSSTLTYDHIINPIIQPSELESQKEEFLKAYDDSSLFLTFFRVKETGEQFLEALLTEGECYYIPIIDGSGIVHQKIDNRYCRPLRNENGVFRFVIDMVALGSISDIGLMPLEVQKAYRNYRANNTSSLIMDRYYYVKNGVCFTTAKMDNKSQHGVPPYSFLFEDLIALKDKKLLKDKIDLVNNVKMIHNRIVPDQSGALMDIEVAKKFNEAIKYNLNNMGLSDMIFSISNPFESSALNLTGTSTSNTENMINKMVERVFDDAGVDKILWSGGETAEALKKACITMGSYVTSLFLRSYVNYINSLLSNRKTKMKMEIIIYETTNYNKEESVKTAMNAMSCGGSRLEFMAKSGYTPLQAVNIPIVEKLLKIDELLVPKQDAHTLSGEEETKATVEEKVANGDEVGDTSEKTSSANS